MSSVVSNLYSNSIVKYAVAGAGLCFLGYCIYFDNKRRNHPDFKKKLKERKSHALLTKLDLTYDLLFIVSCFVMKIFCSPNHLMLKN